MEKDGRAVKKSGIIFLFALVVTLLWIQSCTLKTINPPEPIQPGSSILAVRIKQIPPAGRIFSNLQRCSLFVTLKEGDINSPDRFIWSNFYRSGYIYVVNINPGKYHPVLSCKSVPVIGPFGLPMNNLGLFTMFPKDLIEEYPIEVNASTVVFGGELLVETFAFEKPDDEVQEYYLKKVKEQFEGNIAFKTFYRGKLESIEKADESSARFAEQFKKDFKGTSWEQMKIVNAEQP